MVFHCQILSFFSSQSQSFIFLFYYFTTLLLYFFYFLKNKLLKCQRFYLYYACGKIRVRKKN
jgi:hypothetical protein